MCIVLNAHVKTRLNFTVKPINKNTLLNAQQILKNMVKQHCNVKFKQIIRNLLRKVTFWGFFIKCQKDGCIGVPYPSDDIGPPITALSHGLLGKLEKEQIHQENHHLKQ